MNIIRLPLGNYQTNTYTLYDNESERCLVIDPGYEAQTILAQTQSIGRKVEAILLTHGHFDHVGAVKAIAAETGCRVFIDPAEDSMPHMFTAGALYYTDTYHEGDTLTLAGLTFTVLSTPGHTPGSVCLDFGGDLFTGDTLFAGSCGRTDLPGGNGHQMRQSLLRLSAIDKPCTIHPGHGDESELAHEKRFNPYLGGCL